MTSSSTKARDRDEILDAARNVLAREGLYHFSLRLVAREAAMSVGKIRYQIGDKAALLEAVVARECEIIDARRDQWRTQLASCPELDPASVTDIVTQVLDEVSQDGRVSAIVMAEIYIQAHRDPALGALRARLWAHDQGFWQGLFEDFPEARGLVRRIACYGVDERVFSVLLGQSRDYRLLRQSTLRALLRPAGAHARSAVSAWHLHLVAQLAGPAQAALEGASEIKGTKAVLAGQIADAMAREGVEAISFRQIATSAGVPLSTLTHHFLSHRDLVLGGVEELYRRMRASLGQPGDARAGRQVLLLTHEMALGALRDPRLTPFAIDMRRRRAENVHAQVAPLIDGEGDRARSQAFTMALIGEAIALGDEGQTLDSAAFPERLRELARD
ncbi:TetR family transcriptional regulator [Novosphingobium sp. MBES04]|uniref:TetR family transcriptional regulator n=1 Tax=Novosphingobium sp. MBES04 TaxID=1206458 RepID=UPI00058011C0|nr:TetR family transcriptional regulator [Novosphingobium sp. MBES04]GAM04178.1 TetR family transcriptional regulator [Novosphingobium sp. MBES04]